MTGVQLLLPFPEPEVVLQNCSDEEFAVICENTLEAIQEHTRATAAMRAREGDLLNMRFTI